MLNPYVSFHTAVPEQTLVDSLIVEAIKMYGMDVYYIVRSGNRNHIFNENEQNVFDLAFQIEMYIKSIDGYGGDGMFLSNFGIEVRHQAMFTVAISTWTTISDAQTTQENLVRPREGDLLYFPLDKKLLEIKKVNQYNIFYQVGSLQTYDLTAEVFEFSSEEFSTGVAEIDSIGQTLSLSTRENGSLVSGIPTFDPGFDLNNVDIDQFADNVEIEATANTIVDFSADDPFNEKY